MNDEQEIPFRLTVVYSRQSRYGGGSFSSCDAQYAICTDTATSLGLPVHDHFADEGESSETLDRPAMQELLTAVKEGLIERVIVYKVDRLVKPLVLLAELLAIFEKYEVNLVVVTDPNFGQSATSRLASNIVAAASEFQQDLTRDRLAEMRMALMTTSYSHHRNIRYLYYRCRSQAGGRPPCANVSVKRYDIEQFVIDASPYTTDSQRVPGFQGIFRL